MKKNNDKNYLPPRRIRIMDSQYKEQSDLVLWTVYFLDNGTEQTYVWPSSDLLSLLKIQGKTTPEMLHNFCQAMVGKEINFIIDIGS
jgi:hypothetical protein